MRDRLRFLLLQVRNHDDPMRMQEVQCFCEALGVPVDRIAVADLLSAAPTAGQLAAVDVVLLGGSGDYSVAEGGPWLPAALDAMRRLCDMSKPTFASCWGFQALARALGGVVRTDRSRAEVGTFAVQLTPAGLDDPVFGPAGPGFLAQMGHQDIVETLPAAAVLLASSERVRHQAFRIRDLPIYSTQFHCELARKDLMVRVRAYPAYLKNVLGISLDEFDRACQETPQARGLLGRFLDQVVG